MHHTKYMHTRPKNVDEHEKTWLEALAIIEQQKGVRQPAAPAQVAAGHLLPEGQAPAKV